MLVALISLLLWSLQPISQHHHQSCDFCCAERKSWTSQEPEPPRRSCLSSTDTDSFLSPLLLFFKLHFCLCVCSFCQSKDAGIRTLVMLDEQGGKWIGTELYILPLTAFKPVCCSPPTRFIATSRPSNMDTPSVKVGPAFRSTAPRLSGEDPGGGR